MLVQYQGDEAVREVHERAHLDLLSVIINNIEWSQEIFFSSSSRGIIWSQLGNNRHHCILDRKGLGRQAHEGWSQDPNFLELCDWAPREA